MRTGRGEVGRACNEICSKIRLEWLKRHLVTWYGNYWIFNSYAEQWPTRLSHTASQVKIRVLGVLNSNKYNLPAPAHFILRFYGLNMIFLYILTICWNNIQNIIFHTFMPEKPGYSELIKTIFYRPEWRVS